MSPQEYQYPNSEHTPDVEPYIRRAVDSIYEHAEVLGKYTPIKLIEDEFHDWRANATPANLPPKSRLAQAFGKLTEKMVTNNSSRSLYHKLVNAEAEIGGQIIGHLHELDDISGRRFWEEGGFFHHEVQNTEGKTWVISYQFTENTIHKLYAGLEVPFDDGEEENVLMAIHLLRDAALELMYNKQDVELAA